ncbi:hypothetical protein F5B17DRAFT_350930 [Nemania serpens]|nr:hypothetical protein F5B17DRAFT_350930 [Nemania serpens]
MSTPGTPLPTMPRAPGDDEKETRVKPATGLGAKRTPLPTGRPVQNDAGSTTDNVVKQQLPAQRLPVRKSHQGGFDEVDLTQHPALKSATGVVLTNGKYRCGICRNLMRNEKRTISSHNSKLHPKDPTKGSAYLRQIAKRPTPCKLCGKVCSSLEMLRQHNRHNHKNTPAPKTATPQLMSALPDSPLDLKIDDMAVKGYHG